LNQDVFGLPVPNSINAYHESQAELICQSFLYWLRRPLIVPSECLAKTLFEAPIAVVSHGVEANPIFNYANRLALSIFNMDWDDFVILPSEKSAEPLARSERLRLLSLVDKDGYVEDYSGIRIDSLGQRFRISNGIVWNLVDLGGSLRGQAACFDNWEKV